MEITINNKKIKCEQGETILDVAKREGIIIPSLCHHPDLPVKANCRICVVEIDGMEKLQTSCSTKVKDKMIIKTDTDKALKARKMNLELIFAEHIEKCPDCIYNGRCKIQDLAEQYKIKIDSRFQDRKRDRATYNFGNAVNLDLSKCIDCQNCVSACEMQQARFLEMSGKGYKSQISPTQDKERDCIYCGQCAAHCPVGAAHENMEVEKVEKEIRELDRIVIAQIAPAIRVSIGEEFGLGNLGISTEQLASAMRIIGFDIVFDTSVAADLTTIEEADELIERLETGENLPMFTSCCPAWVKYVEFYHPELIPNLTTVRSPQMILGGLAKTYFAKMKKIESDEICVVSIMPCTAKKFEAKREDLKIENKMFPVDNVLTTRELGFLLKKYGINPKKVSPEPLDSPLGEPSGAGIIYGAGGGVMLSVLRTAYFKLTGKDFPLDQGSILRGDKGLKTGEIRINGRDIKFAAANGMRNAAIILNQLETNPRSYDYVEIMACPGGCIGGGGQPVPTSEEIRARRAEALFQLDRAKPIRFAHKNPQVLRIYEEFLIEEDAKHDLMYTKYRRRKK
ncbi:MAG: [FeFe] hydrogenase, group A [bacterium]